MHQELEKRLQSIEITLGKILTLLESGATKPAQRSARKKREKPQPLTPEQIEESRNLFSLLFENWMTGDEIHVQEKLESKELEQLRQFADANNLNVTSKMSKTRILELIAARFREKRQLHRPPAARG
jgi:hypothetical protein